MTFQLSATLSGHDGDVRAVCATPDNTIVSAARDKVVRLWSRGSTENAFSESKVFLGHAHYVNSVAFLGATPEHPSGLIISGSSDKIINVWDPEHAQDPVYSLVDHTDNVCALDTTPSGHLVSGSWDKTSKVWKNWQVAYTLKGHSAAVWAVLAVEDDVVLTGSADKLIVRWENGKNAKTYRGHTDCVRDLELLPNIGFVSCSNDGTVRIWSLDGDCINELNGHTSYVYSVTVLPTGEIASSAEDRSVRIWKDGACIQTILHPAASVWCVAALPNGDIVSGASDYRARVFTRAKERIAQQSDLKKFEEEIASQAIPANQVGDVNKDELPGVEALVNPGEKEGQVLMIRIENVVEAYQWSISDQTWHKIGEVVDAVGQGRKQLHNGKEYDYVFDVDIGDGVPPLKLPYNVTDNPFQAAQQFIWDNELPQGYLDQVANFITTNTQGVTLGSGPTEYSDPFTGASRYIPGGSGTTQNFGSTEDIGIDPWTRPGPSAKPAASKPAVSKAIPQETYLSFRQANFKAMLEKIVQLNNELLNGTSAAALTTDEVSLIENFVKFLQNPSTGADVSGVRQKELSLIHKIITQWPFANRFPGLDLLRLAIIHSPVAALYKDDDGSIINLIFNAVQISNWPSDGTPTKDQETNLMLALRALANLFDTREGLQLLRQGGSVVLEMVSSTWSKCTNKNTRIALVTVFLNFAVLHRNNPDEELLLQLMATLVELLESETDAEVMYRAIVALGTLISINSASKEAATVFEVKNAVSLASNKVKEARIDQVVDEINQLIAK